VFGLGFGYDLAARFIQTYDAPLPSGEEFTARSPHCILFTVFGRMGFVGLASFVWVILLVFGGAIRCAAAVRKRQAPSLDLAPWCGVATIFVTSCFSVMLEGPMAATVFWSLLGLAAYRQTHRQEAMTAPDRRGVPQERPAPLRRPLVGAYD
jgi:O-antigen ligase